MSSSQPSKHLAVCLLLLLLYHLQGDCGPFMAVLFSPFQAELFVGDQSGVIHIWDLKTDHNEQLIPEPDVSINSVHIDPDASYMAAVNSMVRRSHNLLKFLKEYGRNDVLYKLYLYLNVLGELLCLEHGWRNC